MLSLLKKYSLAAIAEALISECDDFPHSCASQSWGASQSLSIHRLGWAPNALGVMDEKEKWKSKKMPPDWLLDQLLCLGGLLTSLASNPTPPPLFFFFILSTHTDEHTHAWPATPDDWLFVCTEEFTLCCVRGNWSPCGPVPITGPPLEGCSAFPMIVRRDSKRVLKDGFQLGGWDPALLHVCDKLVMPLGTFCVVCSSRWLFLPFRPRKLQPHWIIWKFGPTYWGHICPPFPAWRLTSIQKNNDICSFTFN